MDTMAVVGSGGLNSTGNIFAVHAGSPQVKEISLEGMLNYQHDGVVERLVKTEGWSEEESQAVFEDMLRFLWLTGTHRGFFSPTARIDEAWHTFILFTKDYADFCNRYIGTFIHHQPFAGGLEPSADTITGRYPLANTIAVAEAVFGQLSDNWATEGKFAANAGEECEKCSPSTNCQDGANSCQ